MGVQCGTRLIRSPPFSRKARLPSASPLACEPVIDGPGQLLGQYGQRLTLVRFLL